MKHLAKCEADAQRFLGHNATKMFYDEPLRVETMRASPPNAR